MQSHRFFSAVKDVALVWYDYFRQQGSTSSNVPKKKKARARSEYSANKTASLALPQYASEFVEVKKPEPPQAPLPFTFSTIIIYSVLQKLADYCKPVELKVPGIASVVARLPAKPGALSGKTLAQQLEELQINLKATLDVGVREHIILQQIKLVEEEIKEHAARRVDLFFYLLIAIHNKHYLITKNETLSQHGKGSKKRNTQACHSSLFPNFAFEGSSSVWNWLGVQSEKISLEDTAFKETLNITVELPSVVNEFDCNLEGRFKMSKTVKACLDIINNVSTNALQPVVGMHQFLILMRDYFDGAIKKYDLDKESAGLKRVGELQKMGTLFAANP